ncbi:MAG: hypothetical protein J07HQW1_01232 [Haloquadratum walsbyi J07HQW1]|uniref:Uncharacterized protein n=1 Tax=Haloquadratum walsbyi J07HQW1 TaxID=1238424 RepID=U1N3S4_9EURY|nr:MAG: hypothetical protein J07HQW1_01232 [Haloquadratum walsbyi J07HQW1]
MSWSKAIARVYSLEALIGIDSAQEPTGQSVFTVMLR